MEKRDAESSNEYREYVVVTVSEDAMKATADFLPLPEEAEFSREDIEDIMYANGITNGILMDNLSYAALRSKRDKAEVSGVPAALGLPPVVEVAAYYTLLPQFMETKKPHKEGAAENAKIDFREFSPFTIVNEGDKLASYTPRKPGALGCNVYGADIPFETAKIGNICAGKNTRADETGIFSTICGQLIVTDGRVDVEEDLVIAGSVDYSTGHIDFPGDVTVYGEVKDCFKLHSGASISCKQTLDASDVFAAGDLEVLGGIIGRNPLELQARRARADDAAHPIEDKRAEIKVNGNVKTMHITHCQFFCRGDVDVDKLILDSQVFALGQVRMNDRAVIESSEIYALHGVAAGTVENRTGKASKFRLGIDWTFLDDVAQNAAKIAALSKDIDKIQRFRFSPHFNTNTWERAEILLLNMEKDKAALTGERETLLKKLYADDGAALQIAGSLAAGTVVEIGRQRLVAPFKIEKAALRMNSERTTIVVAEYESQEQSAKKLKLLFGRRKSPPAAPAS